MGGGRSTSELGPTWSLWGLQCFSTKPSYLDRSNKTTWKLERKPQSQARPAGTSSVSASQTDSSGQTLAPLWQVVPVMLMGAAGLWSPAALREGFRAISHHFEDGTAIVVPSVQRVVQPSPHVEYFHHPKGNPLSFYQAASCFIFCLTLFHKYLFLSPDTLNYLVR